MTLVYGIGISSDGRHVKTVDRKQTKLYSLWLNMMKRCYSQWHTAKHPTYAECEVSREWHDFQEFGDWAVEQIGYGVEGFQLDKDLLVRDNKLYGPATCVFLPSQVNSVMLGCNATRGEYPKGVHFDLTRGNFQAYHTEFGKRVHLGRHATPEAAFAAYKVAKERYLKAVAEKYKDQIDERAYKALLTYEVRIND